MKEIIAVISFISLSVLAFAQEPVMLDSLNQQPLIFEHTTSDT